ncbi:MAG TPA: SDR family NAD(P)-dependent oxidoreductase [Woeseiaceae bacterium]
MIFKDKTVIITGGSEGIGAAAARGFAEAGANLLLVARNRKKLEALAQELRDKTRVEIFAMDVSDPDASVDLFKKADYDFGRIDILVNNAGYHERGPVEKVEAADLARMVDVNLRAPILLSRLALPYLRDAGGGVIVNVGSLYGRTPAPGQAAYCATKAGLRFFTRALAEELRHDTIKVALVAPGPVDTGFIMDNLDRASNLTFSQPISSAAEVAQAILDICGNDRVEISMPTSTAIIANLNYIFPWLGRIMRPFLEKKGARVKAQIKARRKAAAP